MTSFHKIKFRNSTTLPTTKSSTKKYVNKKICSVKIVIVSKIVIIGLFNSKGAPTVSAILLIITISYRNIFLLLLKA